MSMKKNTDELINEIKNSYSIEDFIKNNQTEYFNISADEYLRRLIKEKGLKMSQISINSCLGDYIYKIFNGSRKATRDVYISIAIAMQLEYNELQILLRLAKYLMLDPRDKRDSIFIYAISQKLTVIKTNEILFNCNEIILGSNTFKK